MSQLVFGAFLEGGSPVRCAAAARREEPDRPHGCAINDLKGAAAIV